MSALHRRGEGANCACLAAQASNAQLMRLRQSEKSAAATRAGEGRGDGLPADGHGDEEENDRVPQQVPHSRGAVGNRPVYASQTAVAGGDSGSSDSASAVRAMLRQAVASMDAAALESAVAQAEELGLEQEAAHGRKKLAAIRG